MAVGWLDRNGQTQAFRVSVNAHGNVIEQRDDVTNELQHAYLRWQESLVVLEVPPVPADKREGAAIPTNKTHSQGPSDQDDSEVGTTINGSHPPQRSFLSTTGDANLSSSQGIRTTGKNPTVCQAAARREASATPKKHTTADAQPVPPLPRKKTKETIEYHQLVSLIFMDQTKSENLICVKSHLTHRTLFCRIICVTFTRVTVLWPYNPAVL
jgi:hypothetical protein